MDLNGTNRTRNLQEVLHGYGTWGEIEEEGNGEFFSKPKGQCKEYVITIVVSTCG